MRPSIPLRSLALAGFAALALAAALPAAAQQAVPTDSAQQTGENKDRSLLGRARDRLDARAEERTKGTYPMLERGRERRGETETEENLSLQRRRASEQRQQASDIRHGLRDLGVNDATDYVDKVPPITSNLPIPNTASAAARQDAAAARYATRPAGRLGGIEPDPIYSAPVGSEPQALTRTTPGNGNSPVTAPQNPQVASQPQMQQQLPDQRQYLDGSGLQPSVADTDPRRTQPAAPQGELSVGNPRTGRNFGDTAPSPAGSGGARIAIPAPAQDGGYIQEDAQDYGAVPGNGAAQPAGSGRLLVGDEARRSFNDGTATPTVPAQPRQYVDPGQPVQ